MKRILFVILSLILLCGLLAGCQAPAEEKVTTPAEEEVSGWEGKVLNLHGWDDPHTLDPAVAAESSSHEYIVQLFSGLVRLDDNLKPAPDIAERWEITNSGKTYTFYLRRDVRFHDGRGVTAEDFKYSWERACWPETWQFVTDHPPAASYLNDIIGVKDVLAGSSKEISGVSVINDYTLEVTIDAPKSYFLSKLTYATAFVVDKANVKSGSRWWQSPNGTGPFKLKQWQEGNLLILERNALYYGEKAKIGLVVFKVLGGRPMDMYEAGTIDIASVSLGSIDRVTDPAGTFYRELMVVPQLSFYYIGFNTTKPPFDDVNIRRAFSMAIDREKLASLVFSDMVEPAYGILPPGLPGFNSNLSGLRFDVEEAKQLIRESKYGDVSKLPPVTLTSYGWGGLISQYLQAIVHEWRQNLGVEVQVRQLEPERFFYHLEQEKDEMFDIGWIADYPHPQNFLEILFRTGSENNYGEYSNPGVDALLEKAGVELDTNLSLELYQQAEQKLVDDAACLSLWFDKAYILVKPNVKGYRLSPQGLAMLNRVSIE